MINMEKIKEILKQDKNRTEILRIVYELGLP